MNGDTNNKILKEQNVKIWNGNGTREFLDSRGLNYLKEDDLGPVYGHQWRFGMRYIVENLVVVKTIKVKE